MKRFFENFTGWVKGWRLDKFFKGFIKGAQDPKTRDEAAEKLQLTAEKSNDFINKVRQWLASPVGDIITAVIPGDWDDKLKALATDFLTKFAKQSAMLMGCFDSNKEVGAQLLCVYEKVTGIGSEDKVKGFFHELAVLAVKDLADGQLTFAEAVIAAQTVYELITKKKTA